MKLLEAVINSVRQLLGHYVNRGLPLEMEKDFEVIVWRSAALHEGG